MTTMTTLSPAQLLGQEIFHLLKNGDKGAALIAAQRGWRDFPDEALVQGMTFQKLTVILAAETGGKAEPAAPVESAPVSAVPVAPVSAVPVAAVAPVSAVPVSAPVAGVTLVIERTASDGTVITPPKGAPKLNDVLKPLGWGWAKRGFYYLGDRDTAPDMAAISQTLAALAAAGLTAQSTVVGNEAARPVSAVPVSARPVSAAPRTPTRRQRAQFTSKRPGPVEVSYQHPQPPVSAVPMSPAPVVAFQAPVSPAAPVVDPAMAMMMAQMQQMQAALQTLMGAPAAAPVAAPVVAPVVPVVDPVSEQALAEDVLADLIDQKTAAVVADVEALTWQFRLADGASARKTAQELRSELRNRVGAWWEHHHAGAVTFNVYADDAKVIHIRVASAAGSNLSARKVSEQVAGTALTVRGIWSRSTTKKA